MKIEDFTRYEYRFSADELGMNTLARVMYGCGIAAVLQIAKDECGYYYYGVFCDHCDKGTALDREKCREFIVSNETNGYSCGPFCDLEELNKQMAEDKVTGYGKITEF